MTEDARHSVSVAAVVVDGRGRALLIQRCDNGRWEPPGGVLELGEPIISGLRREVSEETGLDVQPERLTGVYKNMSLGIVALVFRCAPVGGSLVETEEAGAHLWATHGEIRELMTEAYAVRVLDGLRIGNGQPPAVREHDGEHLI